MASYGIGLGPAAQLIPVEVFPTTIRAKALCISVIINRGTAAVMSATLLILSEAFSWPKVLFSLAGICLLVCILLYFYLPETNGVSLEDMPLCFAEVTQDLSVMEAETKVKGYNLNDRAYNKSFQMPTGTRMLRI